MNERPFIALTQCVMTVSQRANEGHEPPSRRSVPLVPDRGFHATPSNDAHDKSMGPARR